LRVAYVDDRGRLRHPSDLTDKEWSRVEPRIPPAKRGGRKREVVVREVANGVMYVLSNGCQWRYIPKDLPPRGTVHDYLTPRNYDGTIEKIHYALYVQRRETIGREASPTACVIDTQSVKSAKKGACIDPFGHDAGPRELTMSGWHQQLFLFINASADPSTFAVELARLIANSPIVVAAVLLIALSVWGQPIRRGGTSPVHGKELSGGSVSSVCPIPMLVAVVSGGIARFGRPIVTGSISPLADGPYELSLRALHLPPMLIPRQSSSGQIHVRR
jgi:transposase